MLFSGEIQCRRAWGEEYLFWHNAKLHGVRETCIHFAVSEDDYVEIVQGMNGIGKAEICLFNEGLLPFDVNKN